MGANVSLQDSGTPGPSQSPSKPPVVFSRLSQTHTASETDLSAKEKKKKASKFATLRKKLIRVRRHSRSFDYGRSLRELISSWSVRDLSALVHEYEALASLKELAIVANSARAPSSSVRQDLCHLSDFKFCTDVDLIYRGACFPAHRCLLASRSQFFRTLLARHTGSSQIPVKLRTAGVDQELFAALLRYLYTETIKTEKRLESHDILHRLAEELGLPNSLEQDLCNLLETGDYSDAVLVFSSESDMKDSISSEAGSSEALNRSSKHELPCHKAILAARSPFFRNLLLRRARSGEELTERTLQVQTRIVLDESVIPRRYARVLLHALYLETVDLSLIMRGSASMCSLSEVQAIVAGKGQLTILDEAMEIYQIGQFLDFTALSQGCEDIIADSITLDNLLSILTWAAEPHGSKWVLRQAFHFLREEFIQVANSPVLYELNKSHLVEALSSDFLQAAELDILSAVLKWAEHHLIRRIEEREPNLLSQTAHSVSRKGVKRRDLNDEELRDILAEILPLVRLDHVIPHNSEVLINAIRRGLVSKPPCHMMGDIETSHCVSAWVHGKHTGIFQRPRLFTPFYEEAKSVLEEHLSQGQEQELLRARPIQMSSIPDTLYMVGDPQYAQPYAPVPPPTGAIDIVAGTIPVPPSELLGRMLRREQDLQASPQVQRIYAQTCSDRRAVIYQIQLRVVREFALPDSTVEILQNSQYYYGQDPMSAYMERHYHTTPPRRRKASADVLQNKRSASPVKTVQSVFPLSPTKSVGSQVHSSASSSPCSDHDNNSRTATISSTRSTLSDQMPDIAMATSNFNQVNIRDEFEPDIGDGNSSRHGTLYI